MRKLKIYIPILSLLLSLSARGQQAYQFSQYMQNLYVLNSATAGLHDYTEVNIAYRNQWVGIENSPQTIYTSVTQPLGKRLDVQPQKSSVRISSPTTYNNLRRTSYHAIGGYILRDTYGPYAMNIASLSYTFHLPIAKELSLSFSPSASINQTTFNQSKAQVEIAGDPAYDQYVGFAGSSTKADLNIAFWMSHTDYFVGYSTSQLLGDRLKLNDQITLVELKAYHNLMAGYHFKLNRKMRLTPSVLVRYASGLPLSADINAMVDYKEEMWAGLSFRNSKSLVGMIGMNLSNTLRLGYSFDLTLSSLQYQNVGSHELILGINLFNKEKAVF